MGVLLEIICHGWASARWHAVAIVGWIAVASRTGALRDEGIGGLGVAIAFMLVAKRTVAALEMRDIGPIAGVAVVAGVGMTGGAEVVVVVAVGFVEAVVASAGGEDDDLASNYRFHRVQVAAAMRIVAGIALLDKGRLRGCAVSLVAVGADILASFIGIAVAAGTEFFRFSPQPGIVSGFEMRGVGIMTCLTIQTCARAVSVSLPVLIDSRGRIAVQPAWLGRVVATRAVGDRPTVFPGRLGFGDARCIAMAVVADGSVPKSLAVGVTNVSVGMSARVKEIDLLMAIGAFSIDVFFIVPVMSSGTGRIAVTDATTGRTEIEAGAVRMAFGAVLVFVMTVGRPAAMKTRRGVTSVADAGWHVFVVVTIEIDRFLIDRLLHQGGIIGEGMWFVAGGAGLGQMSLLIGMTLPTSGLGVDDLTTRPVTDHATIGGCAVIAMGIDVGPFQRARAPLIVATRGK